MGQGHRDPHPHGGERAVAFWQHRLHLLLLPPEPRGVAACTGGHDIRGGGLFHRGHRPHTGGRWVRVFGGRHGGVLHPPCIVPLQDGHLLAHHPRLEHLGGIRPPIGGPAGRFRQLLVADRDHVPALLLDSRLVHPRYHVLQPVHLRLLGGVGAVDWHAHHQGSKRADAAGQHRVPGERGLQHAQQLPLAPPPYHRGAGFRAIDRVGGNGRVERWDFRGHLHRHNPKHRHGHHAHPPARASVREG
mmetsp:Transcript_37340/g.88364  ORF Transcript_37340/g.88364 Transcript_37340/m.88364 type:complete len:245 (+) Transcript_37340:429-1163(+)